MTTTTFTALITDESQLRDVFGWPSERSAVYLPPADKSPRLIRRPSQGQKDLYERALMASQRPSPPW